MGMFFQNAVQQGCCTRAYRDVFTAILKKHSHVCAVGWITIEAVGNSWWERTGIAVSGWEVADELAHFDGLAWRDVG